MATPTEVLNDDIKEVRGDIREVRGKIDLLKEEVHRIALAQAEMKAELTDSMAEMKAELTKDIQKIALAQSDTKGEFRIMKFLLTLVIASMVGSAWQFINFNARVDAIESRLDKFDARLERLESTMSKILDQLKLPTTPARP